MMNLKMIHPSAADLERAMWRFHREAEKSTSRTRNYEALTYRWSPKHLDPDPRKRLVIVHGLSDTSLSFCMLMEALVERGFTCLAYELANGVDDNARISRYRHEDYVQDLLDLLEANALGRCQILGTSFGSTITLAALASSPERFYRASLQGGFARRPLNIVEYGLSRLGRSWPGRMGYMPIRRIAMNKLDGPQFVGCPPKIFKHLLHCSGLTPIRAAGNRALMLTQLDLRPILPTINKDVLMIGGDRDIIVPRVYEAEVEQGLPKVQRLEFSPCGHYPQYTLPVPMAEALSRFFLENPL